MEEIYVGLGSNLGDRADFLRQAVQKIQTLSEGGTVRCSSIWETEPWGTTGQERYLNAVAVFSTRQDPETLLRSLQHIEQDLGRQRPYHWAPRTIDLDLLLYGKRVIQLPHLTVPHPFVKQRLFVLLPLDERTPQLQFPDGENLQEILNRFRNTETFQEAVRTQIAWL